MRRRPRLKAVTIPVDLYDQVVAVAEGMGVPPAWVVARAVRQALANDPGLAYDQDDQDDG